jgi:hypothetical protein
MKHVTSSRRQIVMAALIALALVGAAMRYWAADPSLARQIGTLLLVLWLPAVGNLVAFVIRTLPARARRPTGFGAARAFTPQLIVRISPLEAGASPAQSLPPDESRFTLVVGSEGFTARTAVPLSLVLAGTGTPPEVLLELLRPKLALPRLPPGTRFHLLVGQVAVAEGTVERVHPAST